jgi:hypothetical protein
MKSKAKELDVDFIGGQGPFTKAEEQAISEYIKRQKALKAKKKSTATSIKRRNLVA